MKRALTLFIVASFLMTAGPQAVSAQRRGRTPNALEQPPGKFRRVLKPVAGRYIVVLKDDVPGAEVPAVAAALSRAHAGRLRRVFQHAPKGFSVSLPEPAAEALSHDWRVEFVEEVSEVELTGSHPTPFEPFVYWGLDRIDQRDGLDQTYSYDRVGSGVHAYVIDCGVWLPHNDFQGRANAVYDVFGEDGQGDDQHGTSVAGIIGGKTWGVAKNVRLHSVRVFDLSNQDGVTIVRGNTETIAAGINFVAGSHIKPAVVNLSAGARGGSTSIDNAVRSLVNTHGVTFVTGAGNANENIDFVAYSPQRVPEAITVGATRANDNRASYSNYGWLVDLFAPGGESNPAQSIQEFIPVPDHGTDGGREGFTGTSASAPHVAGVAALYLEYDPTASPATVSNAIVGNATPGRVGNIPQSCWYDWEFGQYYCEESAPNLLLYSRFVPAAASNPIYESTSLFVRQQYWDVQYREADAGGLSGWTNYIEQCGADQTCRFNARVEVGYGAMASSEANEYRSYWIYRYHRVSFAAMPTFTELNRDMLRISRSADSAQFLANRNAYADEFVQRADFQATYNGLSNQQYVDALTFRAGVTLPNRDQLINNLNTGAKTRAQVLREIVESPQVYNALYNEGWVARCYYLYLRRGPDANGFNAWLNVLNSTGDYRGIIHGFIYSSEYAARFQ